MPAVMEAEVSAPAITAGPAHLRDDQEQKSWAAVGIAARMKVLRRARLLLAASASQLADAIPAQLARTRADTYAAEILPLLAACKFLEENAAKVLRPKRLGRRGLPFWLAGVESSVLRVPFGRVLLIAPSNYPLFLAGVQALQALAAGNSVVWKPGAGGEAVAQVFAQKLAQAGLPDGLLRVTDDSLEAAKNELERGADKIVFTGSAGAGLSVAEAAARSGTPIIAELSGCDAMVVLPSADQERVLDALSFGMRLNGSATCMAPRRLFLVGPGHADLIRKLQERFASMPAVTVPAATLTQVRVLTEEARLDGALVHGEICQATMQPLLVLGGPTTMHLARADVFAPVLSVFDVADGVAVLEADRACPFGLTTAIFGNPQEAHALGERMTVGTVLINDIIAPTADPRVPFGGRRGSGYGVTRGAEGLLEMTAVKTVLQRNGRSRRHYQQTDARHEALFASVVAMSHGATWRDRMAGARSMVTAAMKMK